MSALSVLTVRAQSCFCTALVCIFLCLVTPPSRAAITAVSVAPDHTLQGVTQRLFKASRFANNHMISGRCISAPAGGDPNQVQISTVTSAGAGSSGLYRFDVHANAAAMPGNYVLKFYDGTLPVPVTLDNTSGKYPLTQTLTVTVYTVAVTAVSFLLGASGSQALPILVLTDDTLAHANPVTADEWIDGRTNFPGAYVHGGTKQILVKLIGPKNSTYTIGANGTFGGIIAKTVTLDANGLAQDATFQINSFPGYVDKNDVGWQWQANGNNINITSHKLYSTLQTQNYQQLKPIQQLYEFGCVWAHGATDEHTAWTQIRSYFDSRNATGYKYWPYPLDFIAQDHNIPIRPRYMPAYFTAEQLIWDQMGRCGAWRDFAVNMLQVQGMNAIPYALQPISPHVWFHTSGNAQGATPPQEQQFENHAIISYGPVGEATLLYDPSYGNGPFLDLHKWDDYSVDAIRDTPK